MKMCWDMARLVSNCAKPNYAIICELIFQLRNPEKGLCLDTLQKDENSVIPLGVFACQGGGSSAQVCLISKPYYYDILLYDFGFNIIIYNTCNVIVSH